MKVETKEVITPQIEIVIPNGYRVLQKGEPMESTDLFANYLDEWELCGECRDVGYPWNESYRTFIRKI